MALAFVLGFLLSASISDLRFGGVQRLLGASDFERLRGSHVCVVGVGGVGCWAVEALVRSGVGELTLVDLDELCVSNSNRQIHATDSTIGRAKVAVLKDRAESINPDVTVHAVQDFATEETLPTIFGSGGYDCVLDAIDSFDDKVAVACACRDMRIPLVVCGSAGDRRDPTKVTVDDFSRVKGDGLLRSVRKRLRQRHGFARGVPKLSKKAASWGVPCVYSTEDVASARRGPVAAADAGLASSCDSAFGTACYAVGAFGFAAAHAVVTEVLRTPAEGADGPPGTPVGDAAGAGEGGRSAAP